MTHPNMSGNTEERPTDEQIREQIRAEERARLKHYEREPPTTFDYRVRVGNHDDIFPMEYLARLKESAVWVRYSVDREGEIEIEAIGRVSITPDSERDRGFFEPYVREAIKKEQQGKGDANRVGDHWEGPSAWRPDES